MKGNYVFVYGSVSGLGGRNLYLLRKANYLQKEGWNVLIIAADVDKDNILVPELLNFKLLEVKEVAFPIYCFGKRKIKHILNKIIKWINEYSNSKLPFIVESQDINEIFWGEILAKTIHAPNFAYVIGRPQLKNLGKIYRDIYIFKARNNECIGVSEKTLEFLFEGINGSGNLKRNYFDISFSPEEFAENSFKFNKILDIIDNKSIVITTVSRLEKKYIPVLIDSVVSIAKKNKLLKFTLVIVGDSRTYKRLKKFYEDKYLQNCEKNLKLVFTGFLHPLPKELFKKTNIFIGMGTAVINSISQGCPTICIDPRSLKSAGILGIDLDNFAYNDIEKEESIESSLGNLINNKKLLEKSSKMGKKLYNEKYTNEMVLENFLEFTINKQKEGNFEYFYSSIDDIENKNTIKHNLRYFIVRYLGVNTFLKLSRLKNNLLFDLKGQNK